MLLIVPAFVLLLVVPAEKSWAGTAAGFHWLDQKSEEGLWAKIRPVFAEELEPDDPTAVGPQAAMLHKTIARVGVYGNAALVLLELRRDSAASSPGSFQAYNYDMESGRKAPIQNPSTGDVWQWRLVRLATFERTPVPDVVFQFLDCVGCEPQKLLASYRYDVAAEEWRWRNWEMGTSPHSGWTLLLGSGPEHGFDTGEKDQADYLYQTSCVYRIADLNGDGLDDVATWCREKVTEMEPPKRLHAVTDSTLLFTAKDGTPRLQEIKDESVASALHRQICSMQMQTAPCVSMGHSKPAGKSR